MSEPRYDVRTWDGEKQVWSHQAGAGRSWNLTIRGLRKVLRRLQSMGYTARRGDPTVLVEKRGWVEELHAEGRRLRGELF